MAGQISKIIKSAVSLVIMLTSFLLPHLVAGEVQRVSVGNFGLPGIVDLPTARRFPDGELVVTQQLHKSLRAQVFHFRHCRVWACRFAIRGTVLTAERPTVLTTQGFDAHVALLDEGKYLPPYPLDFEILLAQGGTSEYIVGTKLIGNIEVTAGIGFGRLAGRNSFSNPLGTLSSRFDQRDGNAVGRGGTLGTIKWFQGNASAFYGVQHHITNKIMISAEYTPDLMSPETSYLNMSPWNLGATYQLNDYVNLSAISPRHSCL